MHGHSGGTRGAIREHVGRVPARSRAIACVSLKCLYIEPFSLSLFFVKFYQLNVAIILSDGTPNGDFFGIYRTGHLFIFNHLKIFIQVTSLTIIYVFLADLFKRRHLSQAHTARLLLLRTKTSCVLETNINDFCR